MSSSNNIAIEVSNVHKDFILPHENVNSLKQTILNPQRKRSYEIQHALRDVNITINKGDFIGIVGRNGSGKSTLLKILAEIYRPTKGTVKVIGTLVPFIELGVGFNPELSGRDNVYMNGALLGFSRKQMSEMYDDIVKFAELDRFMDQRIKNYSSGMQVRLAFSIAIRAKSDVLLLDEVLAVGDAKFQQKCYTYFEGIRKQGNTVVFVSHDMSAVRRFCNRAVYIENGRVISEGSPDEIADIYVDKNIDISSTQNKLNSDSNPNKISAETSQTDKDQVSLKISYKNVEEDGAYIGIGVTKDGISIAEINTDRSKLLTGKGSAAYTLDTRILNAGLYYINIGLFRESNGELLAIGKKGYQFIVKGQDADKGGPMRLEDTWEYH